jgi:DNA modification methylase
MVEKLATKHKLIIGNCMNMHEIPDETIHLVVTPLPYFNAILIIKIYLKVMGSI